VTAGDGDTHDLVEDLLERVVDALGLNASVEVVSDGDTVTGTVHGTDLGLFIGRHGQTIEAVQHLAYRMTVHRDEGARKRIVIDAEGYRARREDTLTSMARRLGKQAVEEGKIITFEPMNPQDRRVVHLALAKFPGVVTKSDGEGEARRVQIIPVRR